MESASKIWKSGKRTIGENLPIEVGETGGYNASVTVEIRSLMDATVKVTGGVTGRQYVWVRAGDIQPVDEKDKDEILNKKRGRACCGGRSGEALFEIV